MFEIGDRVRLNDVGRKYVEEFIDDEHAHYLDHLDSVEGVIIMDPDVVGVLAVRFPFEYYPLDGVTSSDEDRTVWPIEPYLISVIVEPIEASH